MAFSNTASSLKPPFSKTLAEATFPSKTGVNNLTISVFRNIDLENSAKACEAKPLAAR